MTHVTATSPPLLDLYRMMARIRAFEDAAEVASQGGVSAYGKSSDGKAHVKGPLHLSTGQEAVPTGVCAHLLASDDLTSTHRGHGHTLAKGADLTRMMCELFGKATGFNGGKGGSMHIADFSVGMLGANGVVAAGLPIATGAAHAQKLRGQAGGQFSGKHIHRTARACRLDDAYCFAGKVLCVRAQDHGTPEADPDQASQAQAQRA